MVKQSGCHNKKMARVSQTFSLGSSAVPPQLQQSYTFVITLANIKLFISPFSGTLYLVFLLSLFEIWLGNWRDSDSKHNSRLTSLQLNFIQL